MRALLAFALLGVAVFLVYSLHIAVMHPPDCALADPSTPTVAQTELEGWRDRFYTCATLLDDSREHIKHCECP